MGGADVRISEIVGMPVTVGSTILLPPDCSEWSAAKLRAVLSHEGSHAARGDFYVLLLAGVHRALFWFNPFAWWLARRLAELAEVISDDAAVHDLQDRPFYGALLFDFAETVEGTPAAPAIARLGTARRRAERILATTDLWERIGWPRLMLTGASLLPLVAMVMTTIVAGSPSPLVAASTGSDTVTLASSDGETALIGIAHAARMADRAGGRATDDNSPLPDSRSTGLEIEIAVARALVTAAPPIARGDDNEFMALLAWPRKIELLAGDGRRAKDVSGRTMFHPATHREPHPARSAVAARHKSRERDRVHGSRRAVDRHPVARRAGAA